MSGADAVAGSGAVPTSVVLPTIGRPSIVRACLTSLVRCDPRADEILVIDSSEDEAVAEVVSEFAGAGARRIGCDEPGLGSAFNVGLREARPRDRSAHERRLHGRAGLGRASG